jgi:hypothetical protein
VKDEEDDDTATIPGFLTGGRVRETGIALVHEGEYIVPAAGSEAVVDAMGDGGTVVNYYFPVEVVVVGAMSDEDRTELETRIWQRLGDALDRLG